jgi:ubiquinone/menaquinone biosynthesis C-methylase UbiE
MQTLASSEFKNCCATLYEDKALQFLLGPSLHPGGLRLTRRLGEKIGLFSTDTVLDAACGLGESTQFLAREFGCRVFGLDLSRRLANTAASSHNGGNALFLVGDGEHLPLREEAVTAAISECSLCLMPESRKGLGEIFRVLGPNGRLGVTDIAIDGPLPAELEDTLMRFLCISNEISWSEYPSVVEAEGFDKVEVTDESSGLSQLLESIKKRLLLAEILSAVGKLSIGTAQLDKAKHLVSLAKTAVEQGSLRYAMITAQKPSA